MISMEGQRQQKEVPEELIQRQIEPPGHPVGGTRQSMARRRAISGRATTGHPLFISSSQEKRTLLEPWRS